jgi:signal peptidase I
LRWGRFAAIAFLVLALGGAAALRVVPTPFVAVASGSMSPTLERGDMVLVGPAPERLQVGDVIIVQVPLAIQQRYNYPPAIVHRIVKVDVAADGSESYRTKGDNGPEDVFTAYPADVQGLVGKRIPLAGYPILFLYSTHGLVFLGGSLLIYGVYSASGRVGAWGRRSVGRFAGAVGAAAATETRRLHEEGQARIGHVETALNSFSDAMREYATHLKSHTAAVQQMAQAAQEIRGSVEVQQQALMAALGRTPPRADAPAAASFAQPAPTEQEPATPIVQDTGAALITAAIAALEHADGPAETAPRVYRYKPATPPAVASQARSDPEDDAYRILEWGA